MTEQLWQCPRCGEPLYTVAQAAELLGLAEATIKYHIYVSKRLSPQMIGHTLVFTRAQLYEFIAQRRKAA